MPLPADVLIKAVLGPSTQVTRRVDIYEADGTTPWMLNAPFSEGTISVDQARSERWTCDLTFHNRNNALRLNPNGGFWYDKIIKPYRGVTNGSSSWERQLGEYMIDSISQPHFPNTLAVTCRDYTKKLLMAKFKAPIEFPKNHPIEEIVRAIAVNGGVPSSRLNLPFTGKNTGRVYPFDTASERWNAIEEVSLAYGYEVYFTDQGVLTMSAMKDPTTGVVSWDFTTGTGGNISTFTKSASDARLFNHVVVTGEATDQLPVYAEVFNREPTSPTRVDRLGIRTYHYNSSFIETTSQALETATRFLRVQALEQFEVSIESLVMPWLDVGDIVNFHDPNPAVGAPTRFLLSNFSIPLSLGTMSSTAKRVTIVG